MTTPAVSDMLYKEAIDHCHAYNSRLMAERKVRLPYLDAQTRVAQGDCYLWFEKRHRGPGLKPNQVYTYPSKRWKKRPRFNPIVETNFESLSAAEVSHLMSENSNDSQSLSQALLDRESRTPDTPVAQVDDNDEEYDLEYEKGKRGRGRKPQKMSGVGAIKATEDKDKNLTCAYCGKKYKNKQRLNYHLQHVHQDEADGDEEYTPSGRLSPSSNVSEDRNSSSSRTSALTSQKTAAVADGDETSTADARPKRKRMARNNNYCDFCLGDADQNKKTGGSEQLVSCADCGRSGHPTCLQFTDIMTMNVKKYNWQCIECKSCHLCGTSDNDEQLLFCDDCDRGYHMYCLQPRMEQPPEGSWICNLCEKDKIERESRTNDDAKSTMNL